MAQPTADSGDLYRALQRLVAAASPAPAVGQNQKLLRALGEATKPPVLAQHEQLMTALRKAVQPPTLQQQKQLTEALRKATELPALPKNQELMKSLSSLRIQQPSSPAVRRPIESADSPRALPTPPAAEWREAAVSIRRRTIGVLLEMDPALVVRLDGAWERVVRGGPHAASQAAHSVVEFVDWCLRVASPDAEACAWHAKLGRPSGELHERRPTRGLRMRYILRGRNPDGEAAEIYVRHALDLLSRLQAVKHTADDRDRRFVAISIMSLEVVLAFLFSASE